jgi:hypothetical protein
MTVSISSVQTTISGAMSSEAFGEWRRGDFEAASGSDLALVGGDKGLAGLESEVRVERRESISLAALRRPFPDPLDCRVRGRGEFPIISVETTDHCVGGGGFRDIWRRGGRRG